MQATGAVTGCSAGIDYLIGEPGLCGHGYGTAAIALFTALTFRRYPQARAVVAAPQQDNVASWRALERAGFSRWWSGLLIHRPGRRGCRLPVRGSPATGARLRGAGSSG